MFHCDVDSDFITNMIIAIFQIDWCKCFRGNSRIPQSPNLDAQEGELDNLLISNNDGWDDMDDYSLNTPRLTKERGGGKQPKPSKFMNKPFIPSTEDIPPPYSSHSHSHLNPTSSTSSTIRSDRPISGYSEFEADGIDEDARSLSQNPDKLAELAKRFEPTLTLEDIRREEEEQAERERQAEMNSGYGTYHNPSHTSGVDRRDADQLDEDFGKFEEASRITANEEEGTDFDSGGDLREEQTQRT